MEDVELRFLRQVSLLQRSSWLDAYRNTPTYTEVFPVLKARCACLNPAASIKEAMLFTRSC